jgi:hypothetical protein
MVIEILTKIIKNLEFFLSLSMDDHLNLHLCIQMTSHFFYKNFMLYQHNIVAFTHIIDIFLYHCINITPSSPIIIKNF